MKYIKFYQLSAALVSILLGGVSSYAMEKEEKNDKKISPSSDQLMDRPLESDNLQDPVEQFLKDGNVHPDSAFIHKMFKQGQSSVLETMSLHDDTYTLSLLGSIDAEDISFTEKLEKMEAELWKNFSKGDVCALGLLHRIGTAYCKYSNGNPDERVNAYFKKNWIELTKRMVFAFSTISFQTTNLSDALVKALKKTRSECTYGLGLIYYNVILEPNYKEAKKLLLEAAQLGYDCSLTLLEDIVLENPTKKTQDFFQQCGSSKEELLKDLGKILGDLFKDPFLLKNEYISKIFNIDVRVGSALYEKNDAWKGDAEMREYGEAFFRRLLASSNFEKMRSNTDIHGMERFLSGIKHLYLLAHNYHEGLHSVPQDKMKAVEIHRILFEKLDPMMEDAKLQMIIGLDMRKNWELSLKILCLTDAPLVLDAKFFKDRERYLKKFIPICNVEDLSGISALLHDHVSRADQNHEKFLDLNNLIMDRLDIAQGKKILPEGSKSFDHIRNVFQHLFDFQIKNLKIMDMNSANLAKYFTLFENTLKKAQLYLNTKNLGKTFDEKNKNSLKELYVRTTIDVLNLLKDNIPAVQNLTNQPKKKKDLIKIYQNAFNFLKAIDLKTYSNAQKDPFKKASKKVDLVLKYVTEEKISDAKSVSVSSASKQGAIPQAVVNSEASRAAIVEKPKPIEKQTAKAEPEYKERKPEGVTPQVSGERSVASVQPSKELPKSSSNPISETQKRTSTMNTPNIGLQHPNVNGTPQYEPKNSPQIFQNEKVIDQPKISEPQTVSIKTAKVETLEKPEAKEKQPVAVITQMPNDSFAGNSKVDKEQAISRSKPVGETPKLSSSLVKLQAPIETNYPSKWENLSPSRYFDLLEIKKLPSNKELRKKYIEEWCNGMFHHLKFDMNNTNDNHINISRCITILAQLIQGDIHNEQIIKNYFKKNHLFLKGWQKKAIKKIKHFNSQGLANSIWAIATLGLKTECKDFLKAWDKEALRNIGDFNSQHLANSIWAIAKLGLKTDGTDFLKAWNKEAARTIDNFNSQELANSIWVIAKLGLKKECKDFLNQWNKEASRTIGDFNSRQLANSIWAIATLVLKTECKDFLSQWNKEAIRTIGNFNSEELATSIWAHALLEISPPDFLWNKCKEKIADSIPQEMHIIYLARQFFSEQDLLQDTAFKAMIQQCKKFTSTRSRLQQSVASVVEVMYENEEVKEQFWFKHIASRCDFFLPKKNLVIKVDGPDHFIGTNHEYGPANLLRDRILKRHNQNLQIIRIPYWEWDNLLNQEARISYIKQKVIDQPKISEPNTASVKTAKVETLEKPDPKEKHPVDVTTQMPNDSLAGNSQADKEQALSRSKPVAETPKLSSSSVKLQAPIETNYPSKGKKLHSIEYFNLLQGNNLPSNKEFLKKYIEEWCNGMIRILQEDLIDIDTNHIVIAKSITILAQLIKNDIHKAEIIKNYFKVNPLFLKEWQKKAVEKIENFKSQHLTNSIWAIAKLGLKTECTDFLKAWNVRALRTIDSFSSQNLSNSIWAIAKLGLKTECTAFLSQWNTKALRTIGDFNSQELANSIYAHALLEISPPDFLWNNCRAKIADFTSEGKHSLYLARQFFSKKYFLQEIVFESMIQQQYKKSTSTRSDLQKSVASVLEVIYKNEKIEEECWFKHIASRTDFYLPTKNLVIEVDGPDHFIGNTHEYGPEDLLRDIILKRHNPNLQIIRIPYWEWDKVSNQEARISYINQKVMDQQKTSEPKTSEPKTSEPKTSELQTSELQTSELQTSEPNTAFIKTAKVETLEKPKPIEKQTAKADREYKEKKPAVVKPQVSGGRSVASVQPSKELPNTVSETPKSPQLEPNVVPAQEKSRESGTEVLKAEEKKVYVNGLFIENPSLFVAEEEGKHGQDIQDGPYNLNFIEYLRSHSRREAAEVPVSSAASIPFFQYHKKTQRISALKLEREKMQGEISFLQWERDVMQGTITTLRSEQERMQASIDVLTWERNQILYQLNFSEALRQQASMYLDLAHTDLAAAIKGLKAMNISDDTIQNLLPFGAKQLNKEKKDR